MARKTSGKRGAAIVAVVAALAALTGPGVAAAAPKTAAPPAPVVSVIGGLVASWAEEASWVEE
jgi:hypothetical protein